MEKVQKQQRGKERHGGRPSGSPPVCFGSAQMVRDRGQLLEAQIVPAPFGMGNKCNEVLRWNASLPPRVHGGVGHVQILRHVAAGRPYLLQSIHDDNSMQNALRIVNAFCGVNPCKPRA